MSTWVERRIAELSEEIRHYPGPIARCDQLDEQGCSAEALWTNDGGSNAA